MEQIAAIIATICGVLTGFGASLYIFANMLDKSNNIGDTLCDFNHYTRKDIHYLRSEDHVPRDNENMFISVFGGPLQNDRFASDKPEKDVYERMPNINGPYTTPWG